MSTVSRTQSPNTIETQFNHTHHLVDQALTRYRRKFRGPDLDEIAGDADVGLVEALGRYDPTQGMTFEAYAGFRIRQAIQDGLRRRDPVGRRARQNGITATFVAIEAVEEDVEHSFQAVEKAFERIDNENLVAVMLDSLDESSRALIRMRYMEDLDVRVIACRTGMHWRGVYRKIDKILKGLKDTYDGLAG